MTQKPKFDYDLIVIGSGAGGSPAATIAASNGKRVAIVERGEFGGESPNWGDVPLGAMLHTAQVYDTAKHGAKFGLRTNTIGYNYPSLLAWRDTVVKRTGAGGNRRYYEKQHISAFAGSAHFLSPNEISVNRRHISAKNFLIATGTEWTGGDIIGLDKVSYHTPKTILSLTRPPKSLFVVGGNSTAVEIATLFATFGTKVHLADTAGRVLPKEDSEVGDLLARLLHEQRGMSILTQTKVLSVAKDGLGIRVTYSRGGTEHSVRVDELLVASYRAPNVDMGLENAGVTYDATGIEVSPTLQTSARHIFAAGAVLGNNYQTHDVLLDSRTAAHNILHSKHITPNHTASPRVTHSIPAVASVGLTEDDCIKRDLPINKVMMPLTIAVQSNISDQRSGFVKLIADKKGTMLGATIVAPAAHEMIHELALAIRHEASARDIASTPHSFMSWSEAIRVAATKLAR